MEGFCKTFGRIFPGFREKGKGCPFACRGSLLWYGPAVAALFLLLFFQGVEDELFQFLGQFGVVGDALFGGIASLA